MKKKLIAIAIAAAVAAPLTAQAAVTVSGDAEFKMNHQETTSWVGGTAETHGGWSGTNRVRVKIDADVAGGVSVHTRFRTTSGMDNTSAGATAALTVDTDYAYIKVPVGAVTLSMGDQLATWGTKYFADGTRKDNRLTVAYKASNQMTLKATLDPYMDENGDGAPKMSFYAISKLSNMMTAGIAYTLATDTWNAASAAGNEMSAVSNIFVTGAMSGVTFGLESTDWSETADGSRSLYLMAGMKAGGADLGLHYSKAGSQDSDWNPIGVINGDANLAGGQEQNIVLTAGMKAGGMDVTVGVGQAGPDGAKESLIGLDLGKKFGAADFNFSYGSYDSMSSYGFSFETKF